MDYREKLIRMDNTDQSLALAQARQLVQEYQQTLQDVAALLTLGASETLLPASKDKIRQALHLVARAFATGGTAEPNTLETLRSAYLSMANFLTYEEANAASRLQAAFDRGDRAYLSSRMAAQTMDRAKRIEQEAIALAREFDACMMNNESDGILSEIDALLSAYGRKPASAPNS